MDAGPWNWLEVAKLAAGILSPVAIAALGVYIHRVTKRFEHVQWRSQKLVEKRLAIYDEVAPRLNDLLCYFTYVGSWRDKDPPEIVALKRDLDRRIHLAAPLFSPALYSTCQALLALCYETYTGWGQDAKLRTAYLRRRDARADWEHEWEACFSESASDPAAVRAAYTEVMRVFAADIGVLELASPPPPGELPANIR